MKATLILEEGTRILLALTTGSYRWKKNTIKRKPLISQKMSPGIIETGSILKGDFSFRLTLETAPHLLRLIAGTHIVTKHVPETRGLFQETRTIGNPLRFSMEVEEGDEIYRLENIQVKYFILTGKQFSPIILNINIEGDRKPLSAPYIPINFRYEDRYFYLSSLSQEEIQLKGSFQYRQEIIFVTNKEWKSTNFSMNYICSAEHESNRKGLIKIKSNKVSFSKILMDFEFYQYDLFEKVELEVIN